MNNVTDQFMDYIDDQITHALSKHDQFFISDTKFNPDEVAYIISLGTTVNNIGDKYQISWGYVPK